jgi:hypothetical protein
MHVRVHIHTPTAKGRLSWVQVLKYHLVVGTTERKLSKNSMDRNYQIIRIFENNRMILVEQSNDSIRSIY